VALRAVPIGQYLPRDSVVHRLDPRTKILATTVLTVAVFLVGTFLGYALFAAVVAGLILVSRIPPRTVLAGLRPVLFLLLLTVLLNLLFGGTTGSRVLLRVGPVVLTVEAVTRAVFVGLRLLLLVVVTSLFTYTTSPMELTDGMERLLRPFRRVGIPGHELAMMMSIALRFIPTLLEEAERIMKAQMARGAEFGRGNLVQRARALLPILVPLFVSAFRRADELALAMEARGYRGGEGRTRMRELRFGARDLVAAVVTAMVVLLVALPGRVAWR